MRSAQKALTFTTATFITTSLGFFGLGMALLVGCGEGLRDDGG